MVYGNHEALDRDCSIPDTEVRKEGQVTWDGNQAWNLRISTWDSTSVFFYVSY